MSNVAERLSTNGTVVDFRHADKVYGDGTRLIKLSPTSMSGVKANIIDLRNAFEATQQNAPAPAQSNIQPETTSTPVEQATVAENTQSASQKLSKIVPLNFSRATADEDYHRGVRLGSAGKQNIKSHLVVSDTAMMQTPVESAVTTTPEEANLRHGETSADNANIPPEEKPVEATDESKEMLNKLHTSTENLISVNNQKQANQAIRDQAKATNDEAIRTAEMAAADLEEARKKEELAKQAEEVAKQENKNLTVQVGVMISTISNATRATEVKAAELQQEARDLDDDTKQQNAKAAADKDATAVALQSAEAHNKVADEYSTKNMEIRKQLDEAKARIQAGNIQLQPVDMDKIEAEQGNLFAMNDNNYDNDYSNEDNYSFIRRAA